MYAYLNFMVIIYHHNSLYTLSSYKFFMKEKEELIIKKEELIISVLELNIMEDFEDK